MCGRTVSELWKNTSSYILSTFSPSRGTHRFRGQRDLSASQSNCLIARRTKRAGRLLVLSPLEYALSSRHYARAMRKSQRTICWPLALSSALRTAFGSKKFSSYFFFFLRMRDRILSHGFARSKLK